MIDIHASAVPMWADCAARAKHISKHGKPKHDVDSVALAVGNAVHYHLGFRPLSESRNNRENPLRFAIIF